MSTLVLSSKQLMRICQAGSLSGGFLLLLCEIRFEHRLVVLDDWRPWIPIVFSALMALAIPTATLCGGRLSRYIRYILMGLYGLAIGLGALGVFLHAEGHLRERLMDLLTVWTASLQSGASIKGTYPPLLAPLSFIGLGTVGLIFSFSTDCEFREKLVAGGKT